MEACPRILVLEHDRRGADGAAHALALSGFRAEVRRAATRGGLLRELSRWRPDLILSEPCVAGFDALDALVLARGQDPGLPFIVVSGASSAEPPAHALEAGVTDWVPIRPPGRTLHAVSRALRERGERTARRQAEDALARCERQLLQAQRAGAVGRLACGVVHDFNNLLCAIIGFSDLLLADALEPRHRGYVGEVRKAGGRAATLARQFLHLSRHQPLPPRVLDLNVVVSDLEPLLRRIIGENIQLVTRPAPGLGRVKADPGQIEQVIVNLVVNARDAMPRGGTLTIETSDAERDAAADGGALPGRCVQLAVGDTGTGMDAATRAHLFELFFSTKEEGKGSGLGLVTVEGIVRQAGGRIEVTSEVGEGTTFRIRLPRVEDPADARPGGGPAGEDARASGACGGSETVLVVEDETGVRGLVREALEREGYAVIEARDVPEALLRSRLHDGPIHLMLADVVLPNGGARELAAGLASKRPDMKVLFMSGYSDDAVADFEGPDAGAPFIRKPFTAAVLARKVREVLDGELVVGFDVADGRQDAKDAGISAKKMQ